MAGSQKHTRPGERRIERFMAPNSPSIAVIGLPHVPVALRAAGYSVLADGATDAVTVATAVRATSAEGGTYIAIIAGSDPSLRAWVSVQVASGRPVLVLESDQLVFGAPVPGTRTCELPATVDEVMATFGAPARGGDIGNAIIEADGSVTLPSSELEPAAADEVSLAPEPLVDPFATPAFGPADPDLAVVTESESNQDEFLEEALPAPTPLPVPTFVADTDDADNKPAAPTSIYRTTEDFSSSSRGDDHQTDSGSPMENTPPPPTPPTDITPPIVDRRWPPEEASVARTVVRPPSPIIVTFAGKGGVGKSTMAIALGQRAVQVGGLGRVVVVDMNRGQGDLRKYLRVARSGLPSIYDAAISGDIRRAIVTPTVINTKRDPSLPGLNIGVILAPSDTQADPTVVTSEIYGAAIDLARSVSDLVIVDTQIVEASDTSGLIDEIVIPLLRNGAWGLAISDSSMPGVDNLIHRLNHFADNGVPNTRMLCALNRASPESGLNSEQMQKVIAQYGSWMGSVPNDPAVANTFETGRIPGAPGAPEAPQLTALLDNVLGQVTGLPGFAYTPTIPSISQAPKKSGIFSRRPKTPKASR
jgi:MinD-like ATPase involved in chromosome partitioning or flagellar assembly